MKSRFLMISTGLLLLSVLMPAHAHTGAGIAHGYLTGLLHPLSGIDHVLVMLGIGLWGGTLRGSSCWLLPAVFLASMAVGAGLDFAGFSLPEAEAWIAVSVLAMGLILCGDRQAQMSRAVPLATAFALGHGYVHASEIGDGMVASSYFAGFLAGTSLLLGLGTLISLMSPQAFKVIKTGWGLVSALVGAVLLIGA